MGKAEDSEEFAVVEGFIAETEALFVGLVVGSQAVEDTRWCEGGGRCCRECSAYLE